MKIVWNCGLFNIELQKMITMQVAPKVNKNTTSPGYPCHQESDRESLSRLFSVVCDQLRYLGNSPTDDTDYTQCQRSSIFHTAQTIFHILHSPLRAMLIAGTQRHRALQNSHGTKLQQENEEIKSMKESPLTKTLLNYSNVA